MCSGLPRIHHTLWDKYHMGIVLTVRDELVNVLRCSSAEEMIGNEHFVYIRKFNKIVYRY